MLSGIANGKVIIISMLSNKGYVVCQMPSRDGVHFAFFKEGTERRGERVACPRWCCFSHGSLGVSRLRLGFLSLLKNSISGNAVAETVQEDRT
jgi:hypothetical protein